MKLIWNKILFLKKIIINVMGYVMMISLWKMCLQCYKYDLLKNGNGRFACDGKVLLGVR